MQGHSATLQIPAFSLNVSYFNILHRHSLRKSKSSLICSPGLQAQCNLPAAAVPLEKVQLWIIVRQNHLHRCSHISFTRVCQNSAGKFF